MAEERHHHPHELLGDFILGLNDGVVTTLVFALGFSGASSKNSTVVVAGLAELLAGGVSMFLGGFLSGQSEKEAAEHQIAVERDEIEHEPEEEREELRRIYAEKGFSGTQLKTIVDHLTADKDRWLNSLIRDELLLRPDQLVNPWKVASALGASFAIGAFVPVAPFLFSISFAPVAATVLSSAALFGTGAARSRFSRRSWLRSGLQMVAVGLIGAIAGLIIGRLLAHRA
jgi:VIT1/CCC1 family predicted Fe2+/Mn2+ transporter